MITLKANRDIHNIQNLKSCLLMFLVNGCEQDMFLSSFCVIHL